MAVSLISNLNSLESQARLNGTNARLNTTLQRLSSGLRINNSGDDAAGLAIANAFRSDISTLRQGVRNANDGLSTLQIVDGGLNTISGLLDRATTLASQSSSGTFSGNRDTLQREFSSLLDEITRQAQNIGLGGSSSSADGRFNKQLDVFIGGGSSASSANNRVGIDLSSSRVDKTGLTLNNLNIGNAIGQITDAATNISGGLTAAETLSFQYLNSAGALVTKSVALAAGTSAANVVSSINATAELADAGINASLSADGKNLVLDSSKFFAVSSGTAGAASGQIFGVATTANTVRYSSAANFVSSNSQASTTAGTQKLSFSGLSSNLTGVVNGTYDLTLTTAVGSASANAIATAAAVNADSTLRAAGIYAVVDNTGTATAVRFASTGTFNLNINAASAGTAAYFAPSASVQTASGASSTAGGISGASSALTAIRAAISAVGVVQGKVGAGQNTLSQAIDLASSQITNFQAAESRIRDADVAAEASDLARLTTLQQAGVAALAQANQSSQAVLSLLR